MVHTARDSDGAVCEKRPLKAWWSSLARGQWAGGIPADARSRRVTRRHGQAHCHPLPATKLNRPIPFQLADLDRLEQSLESRESQLLIAMEMQTFDITKIQARNA